MKREDFNSAQWADYYDKLAQKNYMAYQKSGEPRYDRAQYRYEKIADAFRAKEREEDERDGEIKKRMTNCDYVIDRLSSGKMYNYDEVRKLLKDAVWW